MTACQAHCARVTVEDAHRGPRGCRRLPSEPSPRTLGPSDPLGPGTVGTDHGSPRSRCRSTTSTGAGVPVSVEGERTYLVLPIVVLYVSVLLFGVQSQLASAVLAVALLQLFVGVNEEVMFRGLLQGIWARYAPVTRTAVALIFGLQHAPNLIWGQSLYDTAADVVSSTLSGFDFAAVRLHVGSVWGSAITHGVGNVANEISAGVPLAMFIAIDLLISRTGSSWLEEQLLLAFRSCRSRIMIAVADERWSRGHSVGRSQS